jgi:MinD superfamily P-loop ATPase
LFFSELCHSCGACQYLCPEKAITEIEKDLGVIEIGVKEHIQFVSGCLNIGEAISVPVIKAVKKYINQNQLVIIDAPPGTSCPMIEATKSSDFCLLVTEPTPFGLSDLMLTVEVLKKLKIPCGVVINRANLGDEKTEQYCQANNIPVLLKIPFSREIALSYANGIAIAEAFPEYKVKFRKVISDIMKILGKGFI